MARIARLRTPSPVVPCLAALALLPAALPLSAQSASTGGLRGRVADRDGTPVEAALVTLVHTRTGAASTALSVADGRYTLRGQRPGGPYTVTVTRIGFREFTREGIEVLLGRFVDLNITLVSAAIEIEGLVVEVEPDPVFNPGRIGISTLVTSEVLRQLPTVTRDFLDFAALSPLVRTSEEGVSVAGASYRFNTLNIDGALNQDVFGLSTNNIAGGRAGARVIPIEAVEQFRVEVAPFDIRQSGFTGGALNAVTRSGANDFETSAFGFHRSGALVGELVVDDVSTVPELSTVRAGFTAAGPIRRDRAHFFVAGEWERVREPPTGLHVGESDPLSLSLVPDSVARMQSLLRQLGADPGTAASFSLENELANLFARLDWKIGDRHDAMLRYSFAAADDDPDPNRLPGAAYAFSSGGSEISSRNHSAVLRLVSSLGNRFSNEFSANIQGLSDNETARSSFPQVEVTVDGRVGDLFVTRDVRAGADFFAQDNALDQRIFQLSNNLSVRCGRPSTALRRVGHLVPLRPALRARGARQLRVRQPRGPRPEPAGPLRGYHPAHRPWDRSGLRGARVRSLRPGRVGGPRPADAARRGPLRCPDLHGTPRGQPAAGAGTRDRRLAASRQAPKLFGARRSQLASVRGHPAEGGHGHLHGPARLLLAGQRLPEQRARGDHAPVPGQPGSRLRSLERAHGVRRRARRRRITSDHQLLRPGLPLPAGLSHDGRRRSTAARRRGAFGQLDQQSGAQADLHLERKSCAGDQHRGAGRRLHERFRVRCARRVGSSRRGLGRATLGRGPADRPVRSRAAGGKPRRQLRLRRDDRAPQGLRQRAGAPDRLLADSLRRSSGSPVDRHHIELRDNAHQPRSQRPDIPALAVRPAPQGGGEHEDEDSAAPGRYRDQRHVRGTVGGPLFIRLRRRRERRRVQRTPSLPAGQRPDLHSVCDRREDQHRQPAGCGRRSSKRKNASGSRRTGSWRGTPARRRGRTASTCAFRRP